MQVPSRKKANAGQNGKAAVEGVPSKPTLRFPTQSASSKALLLSMVAMACLIAYRVYDYWVTGFYVSDEFGYVREAMSGTGYGYRWFFSWMNTLIFRTLAINSVTSYWFFLPFYLFLWALVTLYAFYKILKLLNFDDSTVALSLISSLFVVSFVLLSLGFLTEPVGLSFAMLGVYFMVRWLKTGNENTRQLVLNPLVAALSFAAAEGTREPYEILPVGSAFLALIIIRAHDRMPWHVSRRRQRQVLVASLCAFLIPSFFFLQYPNSILGGQVTPTAVDLVTGISQPISLPYAKITVKNVTVENVTATVTQIVTNTFVTTIHTNSTIVTTTTTSTHTTVTVVTTTSTHTAVTTTSTQVAQTPQLNLLARTRFGNTFLIFVGGLILGWGPIMILIGFAGFLILVASLRKGGEERWLVFFITLFSFGSYFVVSYIFSTDPFYLSFANYSTIIRFSDTALPAYFLVAPFVYSRFAKRRKRALTLVAIWLLFTVAAVPAYETYASSQFLSFSGSNPFALGFRTEAVLIRNYISAHQGDAPFNIIGWVGGWDFTPGTDLLPPTHIYYYAPNSGIPYIAYNQFVANKWTTVYISVTGDLASIQDKAPYVIPMIAQGNNASAKSYPFSVVGSEVILQGPGFVVYKVSLAWH